VSAVERDARGSEVVAVERLRSRAERAREAAERVADFDRIRRRSDS
jgi:hypothetical protein